MEKDSFGNSITEADKKKLALYEELAQLKAHDWDFMYIYSLPVGLRIFFTKKIIERLEAEKEAMEKAKAKKN